MITMSRSEYDALIEAGITTDNEEIYRLRNSIDAANGITRYVINMRWQELGGTAPARINLAQGWPPQQVYRLELERRIERADVDTVLTQVATNPVDVQVTSDPRASVGWYNLDDYDFTA
jgi:hypothetical protein